MKKSFLIGSLIVVAGIFVSCKPEVTPQANKTATWEFNKENPVYEVTADVKTVNIEGLGPGDRIYMSKTNPSNSIIPANETQSISFVTNLYPTEATWRSVEDASSAEVAPLESDPAAKKQVRMPIPQVRKELDSRAVSSGTSLTEREQLNYTTSDVGKAEKFIYIDTEVGLDNYKLAKATLRAVGDHCYIWVVNGYYKSVLNNTLMDYYYDEDGEKAYYTGEDGNNYLDSYTTTEEAQVTLLDVTAYKEMFDNLYEIVTNIYGKEADEAYVGGSYSEDYDDIFYAKYPIEYLSDTGKMVNIVLYDLEFDVQLPDNEKGSTMGYFWSRDYWPNKALTKSSVTGVPDEYFEDPYNDWLLSSNEGKYLYVDSVYAHSDKISAISTIVHEFQHMINFGQNYVEKNLNASSWYDEMLSQLCEDMVFKYLQTKYPTEAKTYDASSLNRFPYALKYYIYGGLEDPDEEEDEDADSYLCHYGTNVMFGSWLVREFGGAAFINELMSNDYVDRKAILRAVETVTGESYTMEKLLNMYSQAMVLTNTPDYTAPTFYQATELDPSDSLYYKSADNSVTYSYPFIALNIWNTTKLFSEDYIDDHYGYVSFYGPILYGQNAVSNLRPYGVMHHFIGKVKSEDVVQITLNKDSGISSNERIYLMVEKQVKDSAE